LRSYDESFATIDYSEPHPLLFIGRFVEYDALALRNVRTFDKGTAVNETRGFNCKNCGAAVELRALRHTLSVACSSCGAILDPNDPTLAVLQKDAKLKRIVPTIPLGSRGVLRGRKAGPPGSSSDNQGGRDDIRQNECALRSLSGFRYLSSIRTLGEIRSVAPRPSSDATDGDADDRTFTTSNPRPPAPSSCSRVPRRRGRGSVEVAFRGAAVRVVEEGTKSEAPGRSEIPPVSRSGRHSRFPENRGDWRVRTSRRLMQARPRATANLCGAAGLLLLLAAAR
jgi:hypothetical protein